MTKLKKILLITNGVLLILVAGFGIYYWQHYFGAKPTPTPDSNNQTNNNNGDQTPTTKPRVYLVTNKKILAPHLSSAGNQIQYFGLPDYELYASTFDASTEAKITSPSFVVKELIQVIWAGPQNQLIAVFADENNQIQKYFYDMTTNMSNVLDPAIKSVAFSPDGQKIIFHYLNDQTGENIIALADPTGLGIKSLWQTTVRDWQISWPSAAKIGLQTPPSAYSGSLSYTINPDTIERQEIFSNVVSLDTLWSPNGDKLLFSKLVNQKLRLYIQAAGKTQELNATGMAAKCLLVDNDNIYCALSINWPENTKLPDDYYKGIVPLSDEIWQIDAASGQKTKIASAGEFTTSLDVEQMLISPEKDYLFILNKKDHHLYGVKL